MKRCVQCGRKISKNYHYSYGDTCEKCYVKKAIKIFVFSIVIMFLLTNVLSCSSGLLRQSPPLNDSDTFYKFTGRPGIIFHNRCELLEGKDRMCTLTEHEILDKWDTFYPGHMIIGIEKCF